MLASNDANAHSYEGDPEYYQVILRMCVRLLASCGALKVTEIKTEIHDLHIGYRVRLAFLRELLARESGLFYQIRGGKYKLRAAGKGMADFLFAQDGGEVYAIYKITNLHTGRSYIGQTNNPERRKGEHFSQLRHNKHLTRKLQEEFEEYGEEAFDFEILENGIPDFRRTAREVHFINLFDAVAVGYNQEAPKQKKFRW